MKHIELVCPKCGGKLINDIEDDIACLQCGYRTYGKNSNQFFDLKNTDSPKLPKHNGRHVNYDE